MRWCRQSQKNLSTPTSLEMAMIQYFDHLFFKGSPSGIGRTVLASVCHCRPDWALCLRSDVAESKRPEGLGTPSARKLEGPAAVDPRARPRPRIGAARPLRDVNSDATGHRCVSTSRRDRVAERRQLGSATPGSRGAFRPVGPALVPSLRRDCEQNPAAKRHNHMDSSSRLWLGPLVNLIAKELRAAAQRLQVGYLDITPHVMRHSGPSNDRASHCKTIEEVQKRCSRYEKSARISRLVADLPAQALAKIQEHARKVPANLMPAGLSERNVKRAPPKPLQRDAVAARTSKRSRAERPLC